MNQPIQLTVGGRPRRFALHLPRTGSGGGIPLVIVLHGNHPDANGQMNGTAAPTANYAAGRSR